MLSNIIDFLNKVNKSKKTFIFKAGKDFETIKYDSISNGKVYYNFSQYENKNSEPYYTGIVPDYEIIQILKSTFRDYTNAQQIDI